MRHREKRGTNDETISHLLASTLERGDYHVIFPHSDGESDLKVATS
ncbi:MAG: hypothetical protein AAF632_25175 [Bacteroidota bacterium]